MNLTDKLLGQLAHTVQIEQDFDATTLVITTTTCVAGKEVHCHQWNLVDVFWAFEEYRESCGNPDE